MLLKKGNGEWGMGNGEWGMGNGEWGMGNGEWGMGNGEWGMGNGEWGMGNGEWGMGTGKWEIVVRVTEVIEKLECAHRRKYRSGAIRRISLLGDITSSLTSMEGKSILVSLYSHYFLKLNKINQRMLLFRQRKCPCECCRHRQVSKLETLVSLLSKLIVERETQA